MARPLPLPRLRSLPAVRLAPREEWRLSGLDVAAAAALWLAASVLYVLFRLRFQTGDSLSYLASAQNGQDLFHPQHLWFNATVRGLYFGLDQICGSCNPLEAAQVLGIASAGVVLVCTYLIARRITGSRGIALGAGAALLACYGFWRYSTQAEVYHPSLVFLALIVAVLVFKGERWAPRHMFGLGTLLFLAIMYHQSSVLMSFPLAAYLLVSEGRAAGGSRPAWLRRLLPAASVLVVAGSLTILAYVVAFGLSTEEWSLRAADAFLFRMATYPYPEWGAWSNVSKNGLRALAEAHLWMVSPKLAFLNPKAPMVFLAAIGTVGAFNLAQVLRMAEGWRLRWFLLVWLAVWYGFNLWWLPGEGEFYIIALLPLLLLCALTVRDLLAPTSRLYHGALPVAGLCALAAWLASVNHAEILPEHESSGHSYWEAERVHALAPADCVIGHDWYVNGNLDYHFRRTSYEILLSRLYFLHGSALPAWMKTGEETCTVTYLPAIDPGYYYAGSDAYSHPAGWQAWMLWLFDYQPGEGDAPATVRRFEIVTHPEGGDYLLIHADRRLVSDFRGLLSLLDQRINAHIDEERFMYRQWYEEKGPAATYVRGV